MKSGGSFAPTFSGGFLPLQGGLLAGVPGMSVVEAPGSQLSGGAMAAGHLVRPVRSTGKKHVGAAGMLLLLPFFVGRVVGFNATVPAAGDEDDRLKLART